MYIFTHKKLNVAVFRIRRYKNIVIYTLEKNMQSKLRKINIVEILDKVNLIIKLF